MRLELRVCQHCLDGDHGDERRTAILNDMVACAERVKEYKDVLGLETVNIQKVTGTDGGKPETLPVVTATIQNDQIVLNDTQLVAEGEDGTMLVYPNPGDILKVLAGNLDEVSKVVDEDVTVDLSPEAARLLS
ncbi:hypothetical protein [Salinilacihabitans rarus]|uniref:hypothetical protein n=1 Tax=Salinilacihabitans rarus TaxID=2961596 RepID=UPI0020C881C0|nr:hypothetical protein [Salinilacihabitans rarus]